MNFIKLNNGSVLASTEKHDKNEMVETLDVKTVDNGYEKHVPYVENINGVIHARTGKDIMHPATTEHHMVWFKLVVNNVVIETMEILNDATPSITFKTKITEKHADVYVLCNLHGVWKGSI